MNLLLGIWEAIRDTDIPSVPGYLHDFMQKSPDASGFRNRVTSASPSGGLICYLYLKLQIKQVETNNKLV